MNATKIGNLRRSVEMLVPTGQTANFGFPTVLLALSRIPFPLASCAFNSMIPRRGCYKRGHGVVFAIKILISSRSSIIIYSHSIHSIHYIHSILLPFKCSYLLPCLLSIYLFKTQTYFHTNYPLLASEDASPLAGNRFGGRWSHTL